MSVKPEVEKDIRDAVESLLAVRLENLDLKEQLSEAVRLLRYSQEIARLFDDEHTAEVGRFLARNGQAEQEK